MSTIHKITPKGTQTPRTDAEITRIFEVTQPGDDVGRIQLIADFARTLEEELTEAQGGVIMKGAACSALRTRLLSTSQAAEGLAGALKTIANYDKDSPHGEGICPYGCDCPHIAKTALAAWTAQRDGVEGKT